MSWSKPGHRTGTVLAVCGWPLARAGWRRCIHSRSSWPLWYNWLWYPPGSGLRIGGTVWLSVGGSQGWLQLVLMGKRGLVCGPSFVEFCRVWCSSCSFSVSIWSPWVRSFDGRGWGMINMLMISRFIYPPLAGQAMPCRWVGFQLNPSKIEWLWLFEF